MRFASRSTGVGLAAATMFLAACSSDTVSGPNTGVRAEVVPTGPQSAYLCKIGDLGTDATFTVTASGGTVVAANPTIAASTLAAPNCVAVWSGAGLASGTASVTITEVAATPGQVIDAIVTLIGSTWTNYGTEDGLPLESSSVTFNIGPNDGGVIWFKNTSFDVPDGGGCTPGYWKQTQHYDSWVGYAPGQAFSSVFENAFPGKSLVTVLSTGGGGLNALGRHTVASLLNASSGVNTTFTTQQVIDKFNGVFPGTKAQYENLKNEFAAMNELGCTLN
jgi:hypothetical protein